MPKETPEEGLRRLIDTHLENCDGDCCYAEGIRDFSSAMLDAMYPGAELRLVPDFTEEAQRPTPESSNGLPSLAARAFAEHNIGAARQAMPGANAASLLGLIADCFDAGRSENERTDR